VLVTEKDEASSWGRGSDQAGEQALHSPDGVIKTYEHPTSNVNIEHRMKYGNTVRH
jgi:hypothetical protein